MDSLAEKQAHILVEPSSPGSFAEPDQRLLSDDELEKGSRIDDEEEEEELRPKSATEGAEYGISTRVKLICLGLYFLMNLTLTLYNKAVMAKFAFPWLLTTLHATSASVGCYTMLLSGNMKLSYLTRQDNYVLAAFSVLFTINIAISNVSLEMVSVPFHQIARSTCPVATVLIYRWVYGRSYAKATYMALIPIVLGVGLSTYGDYSATVLGASLTFLGVFLASIKTVATNRLLTGSLKLPAMELLLRMSPLAAAQSLVYAYFTGEVTRFGTFHAQGHLTTHVILALLGNGFLAFLLNVTSFQTNKLAGALTLSVCGNLKQCLTILLGVVLFNVQVGFENGAGMLVTLVGAAWYSKVELDVRRQTSLS